MGINSAMIKSCKTASNMYRQVEDKRKEQVEEEKYRKRKFILKEIEIQSYVNNVEYIK